MLIIGDLNAKSRVWNCHNANRAGNILLNMCNRFNFQIKAPSEPTYFPGHSNCLLSIIDIVIAKNYHGLNNPISVSKLSSDHNPIMFNISLNYKKPIQSFNYSKANWNTFKKKHTKTHQHTKNFTESTILINILPT